MIAVPPRCDGCRRRDEDCILVRQLEYDRGNIRNPTTTTDRSRRTENNSIVRRPGIDYDIELIRDDFNIFAPYRRYTTRSPVPPPRYDEPDPIVLVESLANRATTPLNREIPPTRRPPLYDQFERERVANEEAARRNEKKGKRKKKKKQEEKEEEEKKKIREEEKRKTLEGAIRQREEEAKRREEENEAMRVRGEAMRRSVQEEVDRRGSRVPSLEEEMSRSAIDEAGSRIDSGGDYIMKDKAKKIETDARRLTSDVGKGGSSVTRKRRLDAEVDSIQPKKSKKC
ncbi:hypothetical protein PSHT_08131 [Puccinia striiformis]|uniref:Uncharacterized protein n=1 Tax=Puccinia striiformis TaxID=27350 RepID=A0A2S4VS95_9BASI|nr:hypothetical protein PSHT_08131 [Puccinia striiformis]